MLHKPFLMNPKYIISVFLLVAASTAAILCLSRTSGRRELSGTPVVEVQFLPREDRLRRANRKLEPSPGSLLLTRLLPEKTKEQADNPVLFHEHFAVAYFTNSPKSPLSLFTIRPYRTLDATETEGGHHQAFVVHVRVSDSAGNTVEPVEEGIWATSRSYIGFFGRDPLPKPADELLADCPAKILIQPGEKVELPFLLFGYYAPPRAWKPGTYTVRATVSYAEAPSGETRSVTSEPVTVTVTEEHIKAAEAYWAALKK